MKRITIVMPFLNEGTEPGNTIRSILDTTRPGEVEIIAIDDCSQHLQSDLSMFPDVRVIRNAYRIGSGACKHMGASMASTPNLLIIDAHMRFRNDNWVDQLIDALDREPQTIFCTTCVQLKPENMKLEEATTKYYGANLVLINTDNPDSTIAGQILEPKWAQMQSPEEYEIPCVLGANYAMKTDWFLRIRGMEGLQQWGGEEAFMSLKSWRAGGACKVLRTVEIGHMFRSHAPYETPIYHMYYNKLLICALIFPQHITDQLLSHLPNSFERQLAEQQLQAEGHRIAEMRSYYERIFSRSMEEVFVRLSIDLPMGVNS